MTSLNPGLSRDLDKVSLSYTLVPKLIPDAASHQCVTIVIRYVIIYDIIIIIINIIYNKYVIRQDWVPLGKYSDLQFTYR